MYLMLFLLLSFVIPCVASDQNSSDKNIKFSFTTDSIDPEKYVAGNYINLTVGPLEPGTYIVSVPAGTCKDSEFKTIGNPIKLKIPHDATMQQIDDYLNKKKEGRLYIRNNLKILAMSPSPFVLTHTLPPDVVNNAYEIALPQYKDVTLSDLCVRLKLALFEHLKFRFVYKKEL